MPMSGDLVAGMVIGGGGLLLVLACAWAVLEARASRRERAEQRVLVGGALDSVVRLAAVVAQIEPRAAVEVHAIESAARRVRSAPAGTMRLLPPQKAGGEAARRPKDLTDQQLWALERKRAGWRDADGNDLAGEDLEDAKRLSKEALAILEGEVA